MMSKAELEVLAEKYQDKAQKAYSNYQETGITRYDRERRNAEAMSDAFHMAASAADDHAKMISLRATLSMLAAKAKAATRAPEEQKPEQLEKVARDLVAAAVLEGVISDD